MYIKLKLGMVIIIVSLTMWRVVVFTCALAQVSGQTTEVSQCVFNEGELPINTYVEGCTTPPCQLPQLQDVDLQVDFRAPHTMTSLRTLVTAYWPVSTMTIPVPLDLGEHAVTCNFLTDTACPVLQNEVVQYRPKLFIESIIPVGTSVPLEFRVVDTSNGGQEPVLCIRVPITIVNPVV